MTRPRLLHTLGAILLVSLALPAAVLKAQTREGIKVRGHWLIEVRNPDGTVVTRREFDNNLAPGGRYRMLHYLGGFGVPARWTIELGVHESATSPCHGGTFNGSTLNDCYIVDAAATPMPTGTSVFPTLNATVGGVGSKEVVLTGNATALVAGQIVYVATRQGVCLANTAPANCNGAGTDAQFTIHDLTNAQGQPAPLWIAAGQIVQVTVTISFS